MSFFGVQEIIENCLAEDHEVLTDRGFMGVDKFQQAYNEDGSTLTVAGYNPDTQTVEYARPARMVLDERRAQQMVRFECLDGRSLLVTPEHDMYVDTSGGGGGFAKVQAQHLVLELDRMQRRQRQRQHGDVRLLSYGDTRTTTAVLCAATVINDYVGRTWCVTMPSTTAGLIWVRRGGGAGTGVGVPPAPLLVGNCNYLSALNDADGANTQILKMLLAYESPHVRALEERLRNKGALRFETVFAEETGYFLFQRFLENSKYGKEKAMFLRDVEDYVQVRFESARLKVSQLIFDRYLTPKGVGMQSSVFDAIRMRNAQRQSDRSKGGGTAPAPAGAAAAASKSASSRSSISAAVMEDDNNGSNANGRRGTAKAELAIIREARASMANARGGAEDDHKATNGGPSRRSVVRKRGSTATGSSPAAGGAGGGGAAGAATGASTAAEDEDESGRSSNVLGIAYDLITPISRQLQSGSAPRNIFSDVSREVRAVLIREAFPAFVESEFYKRYIQTKHLEEAHVGMDDFIILRVLGRGGFGTVYACRKVDSGRLYAMKAINKKVIKYKKAVSMTMLERHTLALVKSRFVCSLAYAFQDRKHLYLIMDLMAGGDLKYHLTKRRNGAVQGFPEDRARFHAAEILLGLEAMHAKNIIFRDLKLENVLLDDQGHCKLTDLGLVALYGKKRVTHYAGTPGYIAPEVAKKQPYGPAVDLFSFGVTIYRMLSGRKPFKGHSRQDFDKAVCTDEPVYDPTVFSPDAISLLKGLLRKDPYKRLGATREGIQAIKDHPWFKSIDFSLLELGYLRPPFVPSKHDVNANSIEDIGLDEELGPQYDKVELDDKFRKQTHGFTYVSKTAVRKEIVAALQKQYKEEAEGKGGSLGSGKKGGKCACCVLM